MTTKGTDNRFRSLTVVGESGTPATPGSGDFKLYVADDGTFFVMDDTGTPIAIGSGGGDITTDPAWAAKGDLIAGTGNDTAAILTVGSNDKILMADSGQSTGLKWVASQTPSTQAFSDSAAEGTADTYARGDHKHGMPASPAGFTVVGARVYNSNTQNVSHNTDTACTFDSEDYDTNSIHSTSSNTSRVTVPSSQDGKYMVVGGANWDGNATGNRYMWFKKNGADFHGSLVTDTANTSGNGMHTSVVLDLVATDYIELYVYQDSGSTRTIGSATSNKQAYLSLTRLGT